MSVMAHHSFAALWDDSKSMTVTGVLGRSIGSIRTPITMSMSPIRKGSWIGMHSKDFRPGCCVASVWKKDGDAHWPARNGGGDVDRFRLRLSGTAYGCFDVRA